MKRIKKLILLLLFAATLLAGGWTLLTSIGGNEASWRTAKVTRGSIAEVVTASGTLNPVQLVTVGTQVSGQVSKVYVQVNDQVEKGQLLAEIDPALLLAQIKQDRASQETARSAYEQAGRELKRAQLLLAKDFIAKVDVEKAEQAYLSARNGYEAAKTTVERDEVNLGYARIVAPISGVVIAQEVTLGETVAASFQAPNLFKIAGDLTRMKIDVNLSESDVGKVKAGMPVNFTVSSYPDHEFTGAVQTVNVNPNTQQGVVTYTVIAEVDNKDKLLLPGMTAYVSVTLSEVKDVLRVPVAALRFAPPPEQVSGLRRLLQANALPAMPAAPSGDAKTLYVLRGGNAVPVAVKVGASDEIHVEVSGDGIAEGDMVITGIMPGKRH